MFVCLFHGTQYTCIFREQKRVWRRYTIHQSIELNRSVLFCQPKKGYECCLFTSLYSLYRITGACMSLVSRFINQGFLFGTEVFSIRCIDVNWFTQYPLKPKSYFMYLILYNYIIKTVFFETALRHY